MLLQPSQRGELMVGSGTLSPEGWKTWKEMGNPPLTVCTSQQCKALKIAQALPEKDFFFLGLDYSLWVFLSVFDLLFLLFSWDFSHVEEETSIIHLQWWHEPEACSASVLADLARCSSRQMYWAQLQVMDGREIYGLPWLAKIVTQWPTGLSWGNFRLS